MAWRVISVNVGEAREVPHGGGTVMTGIFKSPVVGPVRLGETGFAGDRQADPSVHGGPHMAAYLYGTGDYAWWAHRLGRELPPGQFGENLTVDGLPPDAEVLCGDRFRVGTALVEATSPRTPCFKLGIRMGDKRFVPMFRDAARLGFYVRVLEPGEVAAGDAIERVERGVEGVTMALLGRMSIHGPGEDDIHLALAARDRLNPRWTEWMEGKLAEFTASASG